FGSPESSTLVSGAALYPAWRQPTTQSSLRERKGGPWQPFEDHCAGRQRATQGGGRQQQPPGSSMAAMLFTPATSGHLSSDTRLCYLQSFHTDQ
ncbi:hypothetical protein BaRGS_00039906, partial [Batillaria attramentaria]